MKTCTKCGAESFVSVCSDCVTLHFRLRRKPRTAYGVSMPSGEAQKKTNKQKAISTYGIEMVEVMETIHEDYEDLELAKGLCSGY